MFIDKYSSHEQNSAQRNHRRSRSSSATLTQNTGTQTRDHHRRRSHKNRNSDNMKDLKVNEIELVESISNDRQSFPHRTTTHIIPPKATQYGEYLSDALGNFIYLPKSAKNQFKVKRIHADKLNRSDGGGDLLSARKIKSENNKKNNLNENLYETYEYVDYKKPITSDKKRSNVVKFEASSYGDGLFSRSIPIVSAIDGRSSISHIKTTHEDRMERDIEKKVYNEFPHVYNYQHTKVPQRHVNVSLMNDRLKKQTDYRGPYQLNSADYLRRNLYVENFEHQ